MIAKTKNHICKNATNNGHLFASNEGAIIFLAATIRLILLTMVGVAWVSWQIGWLVGMVDAL